MASFRLRAVTFSLESAPLGTAVLEVTGLDDEWAGNCQITVVVNGSIVYQGPSPWTSYGGVAQTFPTLLVDGGAGHPDGLLETGTGPIVIENLEPAANFNSPPYILLNDRCSGLPAAP